VLHLPVRANGDGGIYTTAADIHAFWDALFAGRIVSSVTVSEMVSPRSDSPSDSMRYGLGFWLHGSTDAVSLHGFDAGANCMSVRDPGGRFTHTVISNKTSGAWRVSERIGALLIQ
jgi:CubicO group peptidase (beta-lactamase class C family)